MIIYDCCLSTSKQNFMQISIPSFELTAIPTGSSACMHNIHRLFFAASFSSFAFRLQPDFSTDHEADSVGSLDLLLCRPSHTNIQGSKAQRSFRNFLFNRRELGGLGINALSLLFRFM